MIFTWGRVLQKPEMLNVYNQYLVFLFSSTEGRKMNTKTGLHTYPPTTYPPPTQTFRPLPEGLRR